VRRGTGDAHARAAGGLYLRATLLLWRHCTSSGEHRPAAHKRTLLRCRMAGHDVPTYAISRHAPSWVAHPKLLGRVHLLRRDMRRRGEDAALDNEGYAVLAACSVHILHAHRVFFSARVQR
jgi:hypothetical protein